MAERLDKYKNVHLSQSVICFQSLATSEEKKLRATFLLLLLHRATAQNKPLLLSLGVTHVLNAADGPQHIDTGPQFYQDTDIRYHGVQAADCKDFDLSPFFGQTADFIHSALTQRGMDPSEPQETTETLQHGLRLVS